MSTPLRKPSSNPDNSHTATTQTGGVVNTQATDNAVIAADAPRGHIGWARIKPRDPSHPTRYPQATRPGCDNDHRAPATRIVQEPAPGRRAADSAIRAKRQGRSYAVAVHRILRIADLKDNVFLTMPEVLDALPPEASELQWRVLDLGDVVAGDGSGLNVLELEEKVFASPTGLALSFDELSDFARSTRQVIDALFVATDADARPPARAETDAAILSKSVAVIAAWDSTFWLICAPDPWLERIEDAFENVHEADLDATALRAWGPSPH